MSRHFVQPWYTSEQFVQLRNCNELSELKLNTQVKYLQLRKYRYIVEFTIMKS